MDYFFVLAKFILLSICVLSILKWRYRYWKKLGLPQIEPDLIFGNCKGLIRGKESFFDTFLRLYQELKKTGARHAGIYISFEPLYMPLDPNLIKLILVKDFLYFNAHGIYKHPKDLLSQNLFNLEGEQWKNLRRKLTPVFSSGKMKIIHETMTEKAVALKELMTDLSSRSESVDIKDILARYTTDVIGSCAFGIECNSMKDPNCVFRKYGKMAFAPSIFKFALEAYVPWFILGYLGHKFFGEKEVETFYTNIVKETIKYREKNNIYRNDLIHMLLQLKNKGDLSNDLNILTNDKKGANTITINEIISESVFFLIAGFESSSTTMTFALVNLAKNEDVQETLRAEIIKVLEEHGGNMTYEAVMEMKYLDKVIQETLRIYPPFGVFPRTCTTDYKIPGENLTIKKGTRVAIPVWGIHMDPEFYPNPEIFNPENFSEESKSKRPDCTWLPFGAGPRNCLGMRFGILQTKIGLASVIKDFKFKLNQKTKYPLEFEKNTVVLMVKGDVHVDITRVK